MADVGYTRHGDIAVLTIDNAPVNALSSVVRRRLAAALDDALADPEIAAVVIRGAGPMFSGGADIREFNTAAAVAEPRLPDLCNRLEAAAKAVVAALHCTAAGGGLELALGCHYRIADPNGRLGLPEVKIGLVPGSGGTQRLPRVAGVEAALDMITSGTLISCALAHDHGIVDRLADGDLTEQAVAFARSKLAEGPRPTRARDERLAVARDQPGVFDAYQKKIARRARGMEAPFACIDCVEAAVNLPYEEGVAFERATFLRCVESDQSKAQRHAFFAERAAAKVADLPADVRIKPIDQAAVIGCGTMGGGIAMNFANAGIPVHVLEAEAEALERGLATVRAKYEASVQRGRLSAAAAEERLALITGTTTAQDIADADIVIEAVFEDMALKKDVFRHLDGIVKADAILATNTSTLDVDEIAAVTGRPGQVMGTHFFSPANVMRLMENVRGAQTDAQTIATVMALSKRLGKIGVLVGVCDGFVGNRMLDHYLRQAGWLLVEGAFPEQVDKAIYDFGFPMGPFAMSDLAGIDVGYRVRQERLKRKPDLPNYAPLGDRLYEMGRLGQKTGAGWYKYGADGRTPLPDPEVAELIERTSRELGVKRRAIDDQEILERCLYPMINEAANILTEGIAQRASDIDVIWLHGYGFPRYRGGPIYYADTIGVDRVFDGMVRLHEHLGDGLEPAPLLADLARSGKRFRDLPDHS